MVAEAAFSFDWKIENITRWYWLRIQGYIASPAFVVDCLEGTRWSLQLYPMGNNEEGYVSLYLYREDSTGPDVVEVNFDLSIQGKNGLVLASEEHFYHFKKCAFSGRSNFAECVTIFNEKRNAYLPEDTLTVHCTIANTTASTVKVRYLYARTILSVYRRSFVWKIDKFNRLKTGGQIKLKVAFIDFNLSLNKEGKVSLIIPANSFDKSMKYFSFKTSIMDSKGEKKDCGMNEYFKDDLKKGTLECELISLEEVMKDIGRYLTDDILSLECEYAYLIQANQSEVFDVREHAGRANNETKTSLKNVLKSMFGDAISSDSELRTTTNTFIAHKCILSARSPVFKEIFSSKMREQNSGPIDITDLDDDTLRKMLSYMYTDNVEDLQLESACKLYKAAEKYDILPLREKCSCFLKDLMSPTTACDVLIFANQHEDKDLETAAKAYIMENDEVFRSFEWKYFMATNSKLALDILCWKAANPGKTYQ